MLPEGLVQDRLLELPRRGQLLLVESRESWGFRAEAGQHGKVAVVADPDGGGNTPRGGGSTPDGGTNTPRGAGITPDGGRNTPDGAGSAPERRREHPGRRREHPGWRREHPGWRREHPGRRREHPGWRREHPGWRREHPAPSGGGGLRVKSAPFSRMRPLGAEVRAWGVGGCRVPRPVTILRQTPDAAGSSSAPPAPPTSARRAPRGTGFRRTGRRAG